MLASQEVLAHIETTLATMRDEQARLEAALAILRPEPPRPVRKRRPRATSAPVKTHTIHLPPATRPATSSTVEHIATVDDVLAALVAACADSRGGVSLSEVAKRVDASPLSVAARLRDLNKASLAVETLEGWRPCGTVPNWVQYRALELGAA